MHINFGEDKMPIIILHCGCHYNTYKKAYVKYCRTHFQNVISNNLQKEKTITEQIAQRKILMQEQKSNTFRIKPLFLRDNRRFKPLF
jgi:hypothetical protein